MDTVSKSKLSLLELVYPPISNQEAVWLQHDPDVEKHMRESDFYMIAARTEAKFSDIIIDEDTHILRLEFTVGHKLSRSVRIHLRELPGIASENVQGYLVEAGEKGIRVWDRRKEQEGAEVLAWFTTEKLLWDASHGAPGIYGLDDVRDLATYDLLYVGIAKKGDSFDRLIANGHKARMEILANEPQRLLGARTADETYLFLFRVNPLVFTTFEPEHEFQDDDFAGEVEQKRIVADAEKAFVSLLKPQYNIHRFVNYPKGADGLYDSDFIRYAYTIAEDLAFDTAHGRFKGARDANSFVSNDADCILVEGDAVKLFVAGVEYPGTGTSNA